MKFDLRASREGTGTAARLPHSWMFALVNLGYCGPVLLAYVSSYAEGGVAETLDVSSSTLLRFILVYVVAVLAFHLGAVVVRSFPLLPGGGRFDSQPYANAFRISRRGLELSTILLSLAVITSKVLLIPLGIYSVYFFDSDTNLGGLWSASMALSEILVIMLIAILIRSRTMLTPTFLFGFACLSTNLLHGTRIFDVVIVLSVVVFFWLKVGLNRRVVLWTLLGTGATIAVLYVAFASRAAYAYSDESTTATVLLSPVVYEAVFSQMSLLGLLQLDALTPFGHPLSFASDVIGFVVPRFLNPDKDTGSLVAQYADLSPVGAFSGHAAGLLYFGYSLFFFHFLLGAFGSWLQRKAKRSPFAFIVYVYFTGDILFRLMRDGVVYPVKYLVDSLLFLGITILICGYFTDKMIRPSRRTIETSQG